MVFMPASEVPYPKDFPPEEYYVTRTKITREQVDALHRLVTDRASEKDLNEFVKDNPAILLSLLQWTRTGHHGAWVISKATVRPHLPGDRRGYIPDFLLGGKSSDGFTWWVVELKGADANLFSKRGNYYRLSYNANHGVCQLLNYIDYCAEIQQHLRDQYGLTGFREPDGFLIIGREDEFEYDREREKLKAAWNRAVGTKLHIRTWSSLVRAARHLLEETAP